VSGCDQQCASERSSPMPNFENYVDVVGFFDPANTDTLEFVFDINSNGIQIS
jgi:hypothetical protein